MKIVIITSAYPYYPGEQFIEDEIGYWGRSSFDKVILLPGCAVGGPRPLPDSIDFDLSLSMGCSLNTLLVMPVAAFSSLFWKELLCLLKKKKLTLINVLAALVAVAKVINFKLKLERFFLKNNDIDIVYSYWSDAASYAALLLKNKGLVKKVVTRVHGYDLYEERRRNCYMPLKRQFSSEYDAVYALSDKAKQYFIERYKPGPDKVKINPLGVTLPSKMSEASPEGFIHVVSVSFCTQIKRIDKIIDSIALFSKKNTAMTIKWSHLGGGPLLDNLIELAIGKFSGLRNIEFCFIGTVKNVDVKNFYLKEPVDFFINTSESEGIPVSIMECMGAGVPAIAPNVGGISSLVCEECGVLMSPNPDIQEISTSMDKISNLAKSFAFRLNARSKVEKQYNAKANYSEFAAELYKISKK